MNAHTFIAQMNGIQMDLAAMNPEILAALQNLLEIVEQQDAQIRTLLAVNKRLLKK